MSLKKTSALTRVKPNTQAPPLKDFISTLLPAVSLSESRLGASDRFASKFQKNRKKGLFSQCLKIVNELQEVSTYKEPLPKTKLDHYERKYQHILNKASQTIPFIHTNISVQFFKVFEKLFFDLKELDFEECKVYFYKNSGQNLVTSLSGKELIFLFYCELSLPSKQPIHDFLLDFFITRIKTTAEVPNSVSTSQLKIYMDSLLALSTSNTLFVKFFTEANDLHKSLIVFLTYYLKLVPETKQQLFNSSSLSEVVLILESSSRDSELTIKAKPKLDATLSLVNTLHRLHLETKEELYAYSVNKLYTLFLKPLLTSYDIKKPFLVIEYDQYLKILNSLVFSPFAKSNLYDILEWVEKMPSEYSVPPSISSEILSIVVASEDIDLVLFLSRRFFCDPQANSLLFTKLLPIESSEFEHKYHHPSTQPLGHLINKLLKHHHLSEASFLLLKLFKEGFLSIKSATLVSSTNNRSQYIYTGGQFFTISELWNFWAELVKQEKRFLAMEFFLILHNLIDSDSSRTPISGQYYISRLNPVLLWHFNAMVDNSPVPILPSSDSTFSPTPLATSDPISSESSPASSIDFITLFSKIQFQLKSPLLHL